jgi:hypothetical protein
LGTVTVNETMMMRPDVQVRLSSYRWMRRERYRSQPDIIKITALYSCMDITSKPDSTETSEE